MKEEQIDIQTSDGVWELSLLGLIEEGLFHSVVSDGCSGRGRIT